MHDSADRRSIDQLSIAEKILLVQDLWDSIAADEGAYSLTDAQKAELDRRLAAYEVDPANVVSWDQIHDALRKAAG